MSKIEASYDTESGDFTVKVDGKKIPAVYYFTINAPEGYDNDMDDESPYGPRVYCQIGVSEPAGDLKKRTIYTNASYVNAEHAVSSGDAIKSKAIPDFIKFKNEKKVDIYKPTL